MRSSIAQPAFATEKAPPKRNLQRWIVHVPQEKQVGRPAKRSILSAENNLFFNRTLVLVKHFRNDICQRIESGRAAPKFNDGWKFRN
jgi:hypothetical protein